MKHTITTILFSLLLLTPAHFVIATAGSSGGDGGTSGSSGGGPSLDNPLGDIENPEDLIGTIINSLIGVVGSIALAMFIYGGIVWMTAAGNDTRVALGKNVIIWATLGLLVVFSSYALIRFLLTTVGAAGGTTRGPTPIEIQLS